MTSPLFPSLAGYRREWLTRDVVAGLTVWARGHARRRGDRGSDRAEVERTGASAVVLDAQTVPSIDVTAVRMLDGLADDLERRGVRFAVARDVGQVRDLLTPVRSDSSVRTYPTVRAAVAALTGH